MGENLTERNTLRSLSTKLHHRLALTAATLWLSMASALMSGVIVSGAYAETKAATETAPIAAANSDSADIKTPPNKKNELADLRHKIDVLKQLYEKRLVGTAELEQVLSKKWLAADANLNSARKTYEERLQKALEEPTEGEYSASAAKIELIQLSLQWLHFSPQQRQQFLTEAEARQIVKESEIQAQENIAAAATAAQAQRENTQVIEQALSQSDDGRERKLLSIRLMIEGQFSRMNEARKQLGEVQQDFSQTVKTWQASAADITESIEDEHFAPGTQNFSSARFNLRQRLQASNNVVQSQEAFEANYFKNISLRSIAGEVDVPSVQVRDTDSDELRALVQEIQQQRISLQVASDNYERDKAQLMLSIINWQFNYRNSLLELRSQLIARVIQDYAFVLNNSEPVLVELSTITSSLRFWLWKNQFIQINADKLTRKQFRFNTFTHILKLLILLGGIGWLFAKRHMLLQSVKNWLMRQIRSKQKKRTTLAVFELLQDLYIFFVLLFLGRIAIEFAISLGFTSAQHLAPLLNHVIIFFLLIGLVNYLSPLLSQRHARDEKYAKDVAALEAVFESIPKLYLYYWLVAGLASIVLLGFLGSNLIRYYLVNLLGFVTFIALFISVWRNRHTWRLVNDKANTSYRWNALSDASRDKIWEPIVLVLGGGLGVYRLAWRILSERLAELEMTRSFQAMLSRAILERQHRRYASRLNSARFPDNYWRAFDFRVPAEPSWYVSRAEAEKALSTAYQEWQDNKTSTRILICGDRGIGKSELIAQFVRTHQLDYHHARVHTGDTSMEEVCFRLNQELFGEAEPIDREVLIERINALPPAVIAFENIENCLLRKVGGFDTFSQALDLMLRCSVQHMWVATITTYAWAIAKQGVVGANCFSDFLEVGGISEAQLKTLILTRHDKLHETSPDFSQLQIKTKNTKSVEPPELLAEKSRNLYFRILWDYTRGNPRQALYYWKASLIWSESKTEVKLFDIPEQRVLENLPDTTLMILAALIEHNGLTLRGLTQVMNLLDTTVLRRLEELAPHGIVFSYDDGERAGWHVESFWTRAVENYLVKRQFLFCGDEL